jgi:hypothetical protein
VGCNPLQKEHYSFFGIKLPKSGKICSEKRSKINIIQHVILGNRRLLTEGVGAQLCTTSIGKVHKRNPQTIANLIKRLVKDKVLRCTNNEYEKGRFAKTYEVNWSNQEAVDLLNNYADFDSKDEKYVKAVQKRKIRSINWSKFDPITYDWGDVVRVAASYLGCPDQFLAAVFENVPLEVLNSPRESNIKQPRIFDFYYAHRWITKHINDNKNPLKPYKSANGIRAFLGSKLDQIPLLEFTYFYGENNHDDEMCSHIEKFNGYMINAFTRRWAILKSIGRDYNQRRMKQIRRHLKFVNEFLDYSDAPLGFHRCDTPGDVIDYKLKKNNVWWLNYRNEDELAAA